MRVGVHLPQYGRVAGPEAIRRAVLAGSHFGDEFGGAVDVTFFIDCGLPAARGVDQDTHVRLGLVVEIEAEGRIAAAEDARCADPIHSRPGHQVAVLLAM